MSLPIIRFRSRFPLFLVLSCEGCVLRVRSAPQTEGLFTLGLQSAETPGERGGQDTREMCAAILCPSRFSVSLLQFSLCSRNAGKMDAPIISTVLYIWRKKCSMYCPSVLATLPACFYSSVGLLNRLQPFMSPSK